MGQMVDVPSPGGSRELRSLGVSELSPVASYVPLTSGSVEAMKHYLPRVLEIAVSDGFDWPNLEVVLARLNDDEDVGDVPWTRWPGPEQAALRDFLHVLWSNRLGSPPDDDAEVVDSTLCAVGNVDPEVTWYLDEWLRFESPLAAIHLQEFLRRNAGALAKGKLDNQFWSDRPPGAANQRSIAAWTTAEPTRAAVSSAADRARTEDESDALAEIYLRWLGTS